MVPTCELEMLSWILLLRMMLPLFSSACAPKLPAEKILQAAEPVPSISQFSMILSSLPVVMPLPNTITPSVGKVPSNTEVFPLMVVFLMVLAVASLLNSSAVPSACVLLSVSVLLPSIVTLSAPLKCMMEVSAFIEMVKAPVAVIFTAV